MLAQTNCASCCQTQPWQAHDLHIDRRESTVGDCTAHCTGESESGVEVDTAQLLWLMRGGFLETSIELGRAGRGRWSGSSHRVCERRVDEIVCDF